MPRRRNRFADLERQLRAAGGVAAAGSRLGNFADFKAGKRKITVTKKLTAAERTRLAYAMYPFNVSVGTTPTPADLFRGTITAYSLAEMKGYGLKNTDVGWSLFTGAQTVEENYYPALIKAFRATGLPSSDGETSAITGDKYKRTPGVSCSIPFGRTITAKDAKDGAAGTTLQLSDEEDVRKHLTTKLKEPAASGTLKALAAGVSYEPEVFRGRSKALLAGDMTGI